LKLTFYRQSPNFGDELNEWVWPQIVGPDFFDDDAAELFVGIGSIISDSYPLSSRKIVVGSGYGGYTPLPDVHDGSWDVRFVRGPRTAAVLGLPPEAAITDSAVLVRALPLPPARNLGRVCFMPHHDSLARGLWRDVCGMTAIDLIDPADPVDEIMARIRGARVLLTEAMHGAIVADALRKPWIAVRPFQPRHRAKWLDWSESLSLTLRPHAVFPSSLREAWSLTTGGEGMGPIVTRASRSKLITPVHRVTTRIAAQNLERLASVEPQLSSDTLIDRATTRAVEAVDRLLIACRERRPDVALPSRSLRSAPPNFTGEAEGPGARTETASSATEGPVPSSPRIS
jgi:hypothetical protein